MILRLFYYSGQEEGIIGIVSMDKEFCLSNTNNKFGVVCVVIILCGCIFN
ncbi:hypothetical protein ECHHL_0037 [Ehrlichia chaffeensis str. Heartland]|uniref:Lipoprotein n=1 Tax=Ehrlichia chaffeensis (strain ATCC CRL-10679 / Arkansas) TaxID=205920 RepID=Q2GF48_EHRCR|nr:hypothetical protein ECH_1151 [Ehrlichia chaffeensis str. Arkansas]AHX03214.1 hypothetical protein ECHHL_0037 [Ehrlichia chaffeensis str. Heartland]AHX05130.1 hypothetical protein ECHJAX_0037 [Ehrlichia chaffeensis str. Jax]AHX06119.1 hypothetical protein ECHLIB_0037 [Ehrlichia chaffeensis str. Liberty]AHX08054.1 hypothetical protein ECHOSC_0037 [Ehrlichia chaffeensis str. Osceola]AHX09896.1 hypothetical protein ECHWAK_0035 [Ehrlichia chaffeensis str. Wakulla]AHX10053.1 hypothetical protei